MSKHDVRQKRVPVVVLLDSIKDLAKGDPDAFVLLYFQATGLLVELDREGYEYLMAGVMLRTFRASGFIEALEQLKQKLDSGDAEGSMERLEVIRSWTRAIEHLASQERLKTLLAEHEMATSATTVQVGAYLM